MVLLVLLSRPTACESWGPIIIEEQLPSADEVPYLEHVHVLFMHWYVPFNLGHVIWEDIASTYFAMVRLNEYDRNAVLLEYRDFPKRGDQFYRMYENLVPVFAAKVDSLDHYTNNFSSPLVCFQTLVASGAKPIFSIDHEPYTHGKEKLLYDYRTVILQYHGVNISDLPSRHRIVLVNKTRAMHRSLRAISNLVEVKHFIKSTYPQIQLDVIDWIMDSVCVVKFGGNEVSFVPASCIHSAKNAKMKVTVDYLFVDKNDRHRRLRGKLLFKETLEKCEEYCGSDTSLTVDKSTWLPTIVSKSNTNNKVTKCTTFKQKKRKNESKEPEFTGKQMKTDSLIAIVKKSTPIDKTTQNNQQNVFDNQKRQPNENNTNDEPESSVSTMESSIIVDLSNSDSFDNNMSSKCSADLNQSQQRTKLTGVDRQENDTISNDNIESDDELILPRHSQLELKSNRKRILDLENQLKELKHTSIPFPTTEKTDYLRRVLAVVDMRDELAQTRTINYGELLGLTDFELLLATGNGRLRWKKIVVNLIQACFKNVDLQYENYTSLRTRNKDLVDNISAYVKTVCPTEVFTNTEFSSCISRKCHHIKRDNKKKANKLASLYMFQ
ncbi:unnamed protein product [Rotaria sordida]|uniref:Uncharacterized protein n=1 Tax=Rotaria sordida TaxID=392033 RepID=A0A815P1S6_9BILA|nr:unnamed protein product [Rotaria sordida]